MNKKLLITIGIILGLAIVVGGFWYVQRYVQDDSQEVANSEQKKVEISGNENNQKNQISTKQLTKEEIEKLKKEKDLVWYEIPELGIKFLVEKEIANKIGYRDFYIMETKAPGKELFIKNNNNQTVFAKIIEYINYSDDKNLEWMVDCVGDACCPADPKIRKLLLKTKDRIVCYLTEKNNKDFLKDYLKNVQVELINE